MDSRRRNTTLIALLPFLTSPSSWMLLPLFLSVLVAILLPVLTLRRAMTTIRRCLLLPLMTATIISRHIAVVVVIVDVVVVVVVVIIIITIHGETRSVVTQDFLLRSEKNEHHGR